MDALTWFKSVFQRARVTPTVRADLAREPWVDVPRIPVTPPMPRAVAAVDDDDDWNVAIAHAKIRASVPRAGSVPPPVPRQATPEVPRLGVTRRAMPEVPRLRSDLPRRASPRPPGPP